MAQTETPAVVTREGLARLERQLEKLEQVRRPQLADIIRTARETGEDPAESGDYVTALEEMDVLEAEISELRRRLAGVTVLRNRSRGGDTAGIGSRVELRFEDGSLERFQIVGPAESDALAGRLSERSPLGRALLGKKAGETVEWSSPAGDEVATVVKVA